MTKEEIQQGNVLELWANQYETIANWLNHLQEKALNAYSLYRFCQWAKKTPDELLEEKKRDPSANTVEKLLDKFCSLEEFRNSFRYQVSIAVKSYFHWNYADLAKAAGAVVLEKKKEYNKLSKENLRKLWNRARNPRDRALIPFVCSTGVAKETLSKLTWGHLEDDWESKELPALDIPSELIKGHGIGRYKGVRQITFLTPEAKAQLMDYKEFIEAKIGRKLTKDDHIWLDIQSQYKPLEYDSFASLILRLSKEAVVKFTWHDGRRWLTTALEQVGLSPNWARVLRGRKVSGSENPYSRPNIEALRGKFKEALPYLEFLREAPVVPPEVAQRLRELEEEQRQLKAQYQLRSKGKKKEPEADCTNGHCQRIVSEEELSKFLEDGWRVVATLPSGKIVIDNA
jgi:SNF2 family DNA or RNA helicase